jgi:hypothetical protein
MRSFEKKMDRPQKLSRWKLGRKLSTYFPAEVSMPPLLSSLEVEERIRIGVNHALRQYKQRGKDVRVRLDACSLSIQLEDLSRIVEELVDNACKFSRQERR